MAKARITGRQIKDETIDENDIKDGSIKAAEMSPESISGQSQKNTGDATNDRLLVWDSADSTLKKIAPNNLGISAGGSSTSIQDTDNNTKVMVEKSADENKIRFDTAGTERMVIQDDGKVGIGDNITPGYKLDVDGDVRIRGGDIRDNSGGKVIEMDGNGFLKFTNGQKYAKGVLVSSISSPQGTIGGNQDGGWIKFATFSCPGTSGLDTAASTFLITVAGMESSNNRVLNGTFIVSAKFTNNNNGNGTDNASISNAYYEPEGTYLYCEPLNADSLSAAGVDPFDPTTDLLMIFPNNTATPDVDLYMRACSKTKRFFATHLGGTGQTDTFDTDIGWTINTGQSWSATEPAAPANHVKITGTWASKVFSKLGIATNTPIAELDVAGKIAITTEVNTPAQPTDGKGYLYTKSDGKIYWRSHDVSEVDLTAVGGGGGGSGGKVLQVVHAPYTASTSLNNTTYANVSGFEASITPSATSSKILIQIHANVGLDGISTDRHGLIKVYRNLSGNSAFIMGGVGTQSGQQDDVVFNTITTDASTGHERNSVYSATGLDSPNTTSAITYQVRARVNANGTPVMTFNRTTSDTNNIFHSPAVSSITLMEIDGS